MPVVDRPKFHVPGDYRHHEIRPTVITAGAFELLSRNFARIAVRLRAARHVDPRPEYVSFVDTVSLLHDRAGLDDLRTAVQDEQAGRLHDWRDVRAELGRGACAPDGDRTD